MMSLAMRSDIELFKNMLNHLKELEVMGDESASV